MILVTCENLTKTFGTNTILNNISLSITSSSKIGLIGRNGCGKSTMLKIIAKELEPDSGNVYINSSTSVGFMKQQGDLNDNRTIYDEMLDAFKNIIDMEVKLRNIEVLISKTDPNSNEYKHLIDEYADLTEEFEKNDGYSYNASIRKVLGGLGFASEDYDKPINTLSGGQKTRVSLAKILLQRPDILMLDEPTNHLDINAVQWLEGYLTQYAGTIIVVSHDRHLLNAICTEIIEIDNSRIVQYEGNYATFIQKKKRLIKQQQKQYLLQQKEIKRQKEIIERFKSYNREKSLRAARSREKALSKIDLVQKPLSEENMKISFEIERVSGFEVLRAKDICKSYADKSVLSSIDVTINRTDRIGIIGPNGCGKTTLLKIIAGRLSADNGRIKLGTNVDIGYYDQELESLNNDNIILDEVWSVDPDANITKIRSLLATFMFCGYDVFNVMGKLSGGEKSRVKLCKLMLQNSNFLILDEPTNHLDMQSKEILEDALSSYDGTLITVSHDRYFLNRIVDKLMIFTNEGIEIFNGSYNDYIKKSSTPDNTISKSYKTKTQIKNERQQQKELKNLITSIKNQISKLEIDIETLENETNTIHELMCDETFYSSPEKAKELSLKQTEIEDKLNNAYNKWAELNDELNSKVQKEEA